MAAEFISLEVDIQECLDLFEGLEKDKKKIERAILAGVGSTVRNQIKKSYKRDLNKRTGELYKSIKRGVVRSGNAVVIQPKARAANHVFYGYALAKGSKITAKNNKTLTFQIDGKWIRKHEVKLPERDWFVEPAKRYLSSTAYKQQLDKILQKQIQKVEARNAKIEAMA